MKFIALTYDYDLNKLSQIGRKWSFDVYKNKNFIFDYSAASYATFIDKNPKQTLHIYTDDVDMMKNKMNEYNIDQNRVKYIDYKNQLKKYVNNLTYSFQVLNDFLTDEKSNDEYTVKIDNDLIFTDELKINLEKNSKTILVWKYERFVGDGDTRWGEIKICDEILKTTNFKIYNLGVFGYPANYHSDEAKDIMNLMTSIDISDVTDVNSKIYHCSEQTANNWVFHKYDYDVIETYKYCSHYFDNKGECIKKAEYLKK
jgi:hypothetical protein